MRNLTLGILSLCLISSAAYAEKHKPENVLPRPDLECSILLSGTGAQLRLSLENIKPKKPGKPPRLGKVRKWVRLAGDTAAQRAVVQSYLADRGELSQEEIKQTLTYLLPKDPQGRASFFLTWMQAQLPKMDFNQFLRADIDLVAASRHTAGHLWWKRRLMNTPSLASQYAVLHLNTLTAADASHLAEMDPKNRSAILRTYLEAQIVKAKSLQVVETKFSGLLGADELRVLFVGLAQRHPELIESTELATKLANKTDQPAVVYAALSRAILTNPNIQLTPDQVRSILLSQKTADPAFINQAVEAYLKSPGAANLSDLDYLKLISLTDNLKPGAHEELIRIDEALKRIYESGKTGEGLVQDLAVADEQKQAFLIYEHVVYQGAKMSIAELVAATNKLITLKADTAEEIREFTLENFNEGHAETFTPEDLDQLAGIKGLKLVDLLSAPVQRRILSWPLEERIRWLGNTPFKNTDEAGHDQAMIDFIFVGDLANPDRARVPEHEMPALLSEIKSDEQLRVALGVYDHVGDANLQVKLALRIPERVSLEFLYELVEKYAPLISAGTLAQVLTDSRLDTHWTHQFIETYLERNQSFLASPTLDEAHPTLTKVWIPHDLNHFDLESEGESKSLSNHEIESLLAEHFTDREDERERLAVFVEHQAPAAARHILVLYQVTVEKALADLGDEEDAAKQKEFENDIKDLDVETAVEKIEEVESQKIRKEMIEFYVMEWDCDDSEIESLVGTLEDDSAKSEVVVTHLRQKIKNDTPSLDDLDTPFEYLNDEQKTEVLQALVTYKAKEGDLTVEELGEVLDKLEHPNDKIAFAVLAANEAGNDWSLEDVGTVLEKTPPEGKVAFLKAVMLDDIKNEEFAIVVIKDYAEGDQEIYDLLDFAVDKNKEKPIRVEKDVHEVVDKIEDDELHDKILAKLVAADSADNEGGEYDEDEINTLLESARSEKGKAELLLAYVQNRPLKLNFVRSLTAEMSDYPALVEKINRANRKH